MKEFRTPLISEQRIIRTETQNVRITRKKNVIRVRHKGLKSDPIPHYKDVKKIRRLNRGKVNSSKGNRI